MDYGSTFSVYQQISVFVDCQCNEARISKKINLYFCKNEKKKQMSVTRTPHVRLNSIHNLEHN